MEAPTENILGVASSIAVTPGSPDEIVAILRFANEHGLSVVPAGGFTQQQTGNVPPQVDVLLYTSRLTDVEHYDSGDLTIGVGAGWTIAQLSDKVRADQLFFAGDAARQRAPRSEDCWQRVYMVHIAMVTEARGITALVSGL